MRWRERLLYTFPIMVLLIVPDVVFFHTGVLSIMGLVIGVVAWKKGAEIGAVLEREGLHPRGLLPNRVTIQEVQEPSIRAVKDDEPEDAYEEADLTYDEINNSTGQEGSAGELQALEAMGFLQPGADYVMAVTDSGKPITKRKLSSMGIGGRQSVGKTVSMLSLITQSIPKYNGNIKFLVIDPHMHIDPEEEEADNSLAVKLAALGPFLLKVPGAGRDSVFSNPVSGGKKLQQWLQWLEREYKERLGTEDKPGKKSDCYIAIVIDEFGSLLNDPTIGPALVSLLIQINEQARKVKMFALVASPTWKASRMNGTDLRNSIASFVIHNMPTAIASQIVDADAAKLAPKLKTGQGIVYSDGDAVTGWVPYAKPVDLEYYVDKYAHKAVQMLPPPKRANPASSTVTVPTKQGAVVAPSDVPSYEEGLLVHRYYGMLREVSDDPDDLIVTKIAVLVYGTEAAKDKVVRVMQLKEKHGV